VHLPARHVAVNLANCHDDYRVCAESVMLDMWL
jgi:hypothetical protein